MVFRNMTDPVFPSGKVQECWENAWKEYWARRRSGGDPEYWLGLIEGRGWDESPTKRIVPCPHGFVVVDGRVADPTPFLFGRGRNWSKMPRMPARTYWRPGVKYIGMKKLNARELRGGIFEDVLVRYTRGIFDGCGGGNGRRLRAKEYGWHHKR